MCTFRPLQQRILKSHGQWAPAGGWGDDGTDGLGINRGPIHVRGPGEPAALYPASREAECIDIFFFAAGGVAISFFLVLIGWVGGWQVNALAAKEEGQKRHGRITGRVGGGRGGCLVSHVCVAGLLSKE